MLTHKTTAAYIIGGICGNLWMPDAKAGKPHRFDVRRRLDRFSDSRGATFRDVLVHELMENGGDFRCARFTADTVLVVERTAHVAEQVAFPSAAASGRSVRVVRTRERSIATLPDCADLVDADAFTDDFCGEDE